MAVRGRSESVLGRALLPVHARKHGQHNLAVLREVFAGRPWIPALGSSPSSTTSGRVDAALRLLSGTLGP